jgi:hypothetical protein
MSGRPALVNGNADEYGRAPRQWISQRFETRYGSAMGPSLARLRQSVTGSPLPRWFTSSRDRRAAGRGAVKIAGIRIRAPCVGNREHAPMPVLSLGRACLEVAVSSAVPDARRRGVIAQQTTTAVLRTFPIACI